VSGDQGIVYIAGLQYPAKPISSHGKNEQQYSQETIICCGGGPRLQYNSNISKKRFTDSDSRNSEYHSDCQSPRQLEILRHLLYFMKKMIPIGFMFILTVKSYIEANNSRSSVQTSLPSACTATGNTPTNSFCSAAGNAPVIDYARNAWVTHVHQSVTQTIEGNEEEKTKSSQRYTEMEKYLEK
jgi:hypothetical protein